MDLDDLQILEGSKREKARIFIFLLLTFLVEQSMQLSLKHPLHGVVDRVNENGGPYLGLLMTFPDEEDALLYSGLFVPNSDIPWVDFSGRRFNIGTVHGTDVIYVMSGEQRLNAGITVQILLDLFKIQGIVHYGIAGSVNDSLSFGDVSVPKYVAYTSSWKWMESMSEKGHMPKLTFGAYNFPVKGKNLLAMVEFEKEQFFSAGHPMKEVFWLEIDQTWFDIAGMLQDVKLQRCVNETYCLPNTPKVVYGLRGSTADIYLNNAAYREFLFEEFGVSTVDEESDAVVKISRSAGVPCIVFRGVSDLAGGGGNLSSISLVSLAAINAFNVAVEFIRLIGKEKTLKLK
ncbi:hypothetical protein NE237_025919 [Protea cynaroides]|uniref:Nucleoside phosphorylase domain-containing protein n=1 Tax=Protea cynaroides TaxID=273540 RepID=A0A9Q0H5R3_9MAGN|nr:hypothetical protein NE237_025919 [Protea cynaroides]